MPILNFSVAKSAHTFDMTEQALRVAVWGTGNMGKGAIRSTLQHPGMVLSGVITGSPEKTTLDLGELIGSTSPVGRSASLDAASVLAESDAVAYMASGDIRPDDALADIEQCLRAGCSVVTPSLYALYDPKSAPIELVDRITESCRAGGASLLVTGVDPGWGNDVLAITAASLVTNIREVRCQEIFDYSTYHQPYAVRVSCGFGMQMSETPMMLLETIPTMVWGGNVRLIGRGLGLEIDSITETVERRPLDHRIENELGVFEAGTQGAFRLEVIGWSGGVQRVVIEHITRIDAGCAPDWPYPDEGVGDHRVIIDGDPRLTVVVRADVPGGTRADGGNATAVNRLLGALLWLSTAPPDLYDALDVPLGPAAGRWEV